MPGRFTGRAPRFAGTAWSMPVGRALDEFLRNVQKGMTNLQKTPGTPNPVQAGVDAAPGVGPAPALDDHVHDVDISGTPVSVGILNAQGASGTGLARTNHQHRIGVLSAKGDLLSYDGTNPVALPVGANDLVLAASSSAGTGLKWSTIAADAELLALIGL